METLNQKKAHSKGQKEGEGRREGERRKQSMQKKNKKEDGEKGVTKLQVHFLTAKGITD